MLWKNVDFSIINNSRGYNSKILDEINVFELIKKYWLLVKDILMITQLLEIMI